MISNYLNFNYVIITGVITLVFLLSTIAMGFFVQKGKLDPKYHKLVALSTGVSGLIHGSLALIFQFGL